MLLSARTSEEYMKTAPKLVAGHRKVFSIQVAKELWDSRSGNAVSWRLGGEIGNLMRRRKMYEEGFERRTSKLESDAEEAHVRNQLRTRRQQEEIW